MHGLFNHFFDNADGKNYAKNRLAFLETHIDISSSITTGLYFAEEKRIGEQLKG